MASGTSTLFDRWSATYDRPGFQNATYRPVHDAVLKQLVEEHKIGLAVDPESVTDIADAIMKLGELSDENRDSERRRLQHLAANELAYDKQAIELERMAADLCQ